MSKVLKFGTISEAPNGHLMFDNFEIDAEREAETRPVLVLKAVIARLESELQKQRDLEKLPVDTCHWYNT
jgi:hypothetical protein